MIQVRQILHSLPVAYEWKVTGKQIALLHCNELKAIVELLEGEQETITLLGGVIFVGQTQARSELIAYLTPFIM